MSKELTLKEAETIVDTMYQNRFVEVGVDEGNTIHLGNLNKLSFTDLESASILLLRTEIRQKREITQLTSNWNELEKLVNNRIEEFKNAGKSRKEINAYHYKLLCDIKKILISSP